MCVSSCKKVPTILLYGKNASRLLAGLNRTQIFSPWFTFKPSRFESLGKNSVSKFTLHLRFIIIGLHKSWTLLSKAWASVTLFSGFPPDFWMAFILWHRNWPSAWKEDEAKFIIGHNGLRLEHALIPHMSLGNYNGRRSKSRNLWSVVWSDGGSCLLAANNMRVAKMDGFILYSSCC